MAFAAPSRLSATSRGVSPGLVSDAGDFLDADDIASLPHAGALVGKRDVLPSITGRRPVTFGVVSDISPPSIIINDETSMAGLDDASSHVSSRTRSDTVGKRPYNPDPSPVIDPLSPLAARIEARLLRKSDPSGGKLLHARLTHNHPTLLPKLRKTDIVRPLIKETEADEEGILNLALKGFVPENADFTLAFLGDEEVWKNVDDHGTPIHRPVLANQPVNLHPHHLIADRPSPPPHTTGLYLPALKLDSEYQPKQLSIQYTSLQSLNSLYWESKLPLTPAPSPAGSSENLLVDPLLHGGIQSRSKTARRRLAYVKEVTNFLEEYTSPQGASTESTAKPMTSVQKPNTAFTFYQGDSRTHNHYVIKVLDTVPIDAYTFFISHGKVLMNALPYTTFLERTTARKDRVLYIVDRLEKLSLEYSIHWIEVSCRRIEELAQLPLKEKITRDEIASCAVNKLEVTKLLHRPGQRFRHMINGKHLAASLIAATWIMYKQRCKYIDHMDKVYAGRCLLFHWRKRKKRQKLAVLVKTALNRARETCKRLQDHLYENWFSIKKRGAVVIHLASINCDLKTRERMEDIRRMQTKQIGRIFEIVRNGEHIRKLVLVVPQVDPELRKHVETILSRSFCSQYAPLVHFVVPENVKWFQPEASLTNMLLASPIALKTLREHIKGKDNYIVPGVMGTDELRLSALLGSPLLAPNSTLNEAMQGVVGTRTLIKELSKGATVNELPQVLGITTEAGLYTSLVNLVNEYPDVPRWVFKVDSQFPLSRGFAYVDTSDILPFVETPDPDENDEIEGGAQTGDVRREEGFSMLRAGLPHAIRILSKYIKNFQHFVYMFTTTAQGGCIIACPSMVPRVVDTFVTMNPQEEPQIMGAGEQVHIDPFNFWGAVYPQQCARFEELQNLTMHFARGLQSRGYIGHVCMQFVHDGMDLYPLDITAAYTASQSLYEYMLLITGAQFDPEHGCLIYNTNATRKLRIHFLERAKYLDMSRVKRQTNTESLNVPAIEERTVVVSESFIHDHFKLMNRVSLLGMCHHAGMGFNEEDRLGTLFPEVGVDKPTSLMMACVGRNVISAVALVIQNLTTFTQLLCSNELKGNTNFMRAAFQVARILHGLDETEGAADIPTDVVDSTNGETSGRRSARSRRGSSNASRSATLVPPKPKSTYTPESYLQFLQNLPTRSYHILHNNLVEFLKAMIAPGDIKKDVKPEAKNLSQYIRIDYNIVQLCESEVPSLKLRDEDPSYQEWVELAQTIENAEARPSNESQILEADNAQKLAADNDVKINNSVEVNNEDSKTTVRKEATRKNSTGSRQSNQRKGSASSRGAIPPTLAPKGTRARG